MQDLVVWALVEESLQHMFVLYLGPLPLGCPQMWLFFDPLARKKRDKRVEIKHPKASNLIPLMIFSGSYNN